ncbi:MAG: hypothetical protein ACODAA_07690 [Gemmatimonadota bacterium]
MIRNEYGMVLALALVAAPLAACGQADTGQADAAAEDTAAAAEGAGAEEAAREAPGADAEGLLNINEATPADLRSAGISDAAVAALAGARPFANMLEVDAALEGVLDEGAREEAYRTMWIPLDLNAATREEILLIPGVGERMAGEFEEYRPYEAMAEFRREIGKYVDEEEVERLAGYVTVR